MPMQLFRKASHIKRTPGELVFDIANIIVMFVFALVTLYPFWYVLIYALNDSQNAYGGGIWFWPRMLTLDNIIYVVNRKSLQLAYLVTIARTVLGPLLHLVVTGFAAYALSKRYLPGRKGITYFLIVPLFVGAPIVATYVMYARIGLMNNFLVYILPGAFGFFMMAIARALFEEIPASLEESAKMDGAGYMRIFFRLVLPLSTPIVATVLIFSAVGNWLDFQTNYLFVQNIKLSTLQYLLFQFEHETAIVPTLAGSMLMGNTTGVAQIKISTDTLKATTLVVITLPIIFIYPFFQGYIIKGLLIGAIKE
jgi:putative aldouronate transport system permease protein